MHKQKLFISIFSFLAMLCTFFPWLEEHGKVYDGRTQDGWITFALFGTSLVICLGGNTKDALESKYRLGIYGTSILATVIGISKIVKASPGLAKFFPGWLNIPFSYSQEILFGLYLMIGFGLIIILLNLLSPLFENKTA